MQPRLSLCIIAGNESAHIIRLLDSFAPAFDELSLVIALGNTAPDATQQLAADWCASHGKDFIGSAYVNTLAGMNLPHVDDFAGARNQSFAQARGDWLFWADCDDEIDQPALLRTAAANAAPDLLMLRFPYSVPQSGKHTMRERLIRADAFRAGRKWHWPVHENLLMHDGDKWANCDAPTWLHNPVGEKAGGELRNLRILTAALAEAPNNYYYCHQENFYLRRLDQSRRFGKLFLDLPGGNPVLRYQCLLNLASLAEGREEAASYALRAHYLYPRQKEALAALVACAFQDESAERALYFTEQLINAEELPIDQRLWCYEPKWDGWGARDLRARALRLAGQPKDAELWEPVAPKIALLHATRGRFQRAIQCRDVWLDFAHDPASVEHIFAYDEDDLDSHRWLRSFRSVLSTKPTCVSAWNNAARASKAPILVQLSDDWLPVRDWDKRLLEACADRNPLTEQFAIQVSDGTRKDDLMCMAIMSRARWEAQDREMFSGDYEGVFSDNEYSFRSFRDGIVIDARHIVFIHAHPLLGKGEMDATYRRQNAPEKYQRGEATFRRRNPDYKWP